MFFVFKMVAECDKKQHSNPFWVFRGKIQEEVFEDRSRLLSDEGDKYRENKWMKQIIILPRFTESFLQSTVLWIVRFVCDTMTQWKDMLTTQERFLTTTVKSTNTRSLRSNQFSWRWYWLMNNSTTLWVYTPFLTISSIQQKWIVGMCDASSMVKAYIYIFQIDPKLSYPFGFGDLTFGILTPNSIIESDWQYLSGFCFFGGFVIRISDLERMDGCFLFGRCSNTWSNEFGVYEILSVNSLMALFCAATPMLWLGFVRFSVVDIEFSISEFNSKPIGYFSMSSVWSRASPFFLSSDSLGISLPIFSVRLSKRSDNWRYIA